MPAQAALDNNTKVWVCKYVGPKGGERFSHLINVAWNTIAKDSSEVTEGSWFGDNQERSYVIKIGGTSPGDAACLSVIDPTPTETSTTTVPPTTTEPTDEQTSEPPATTTVPPTTTEPTDEQTSEPPATTTVPPTTHPTTPAAKPTGTPPHGTGHTPSVVGGLSSGAPHTGGSGQDGTPVNTLIGAGLLFTALGLFSRNVLGGRKGDPDSTN